MKKTDRSKLDAERSAPQVSTRRDASPASAPSQTTTPRNAPPHPADVRRPDSGGLGSGGEELQVGNKEGRRSRRFRKRRRGRAQKPTSKRLASKNPASKNPTSKSPASTTGRARSVTRRVPAAESMKSLNGRSVKLLKDADGVPHFVSPLVLPKRKGERALDRLRDYEHDALLPICEAIGSGGKLERYQQQAVGTPLDRCLAELGADPTVLWHTYFGDGFHGLIRSFARLANLAHDLLERDAMPSLHPDRILVCPERGILLRVGDVLRDGVVDDAVRVARRDLRYCPPEIFLANPDAPRAIHDEQVVYSLAAILYHCLTGGPPYPGRDAAEVADRVLSASGLSVARRPQEVDDAVWDVLEHALAVEPRERPASLPVFAVMLEAALSGRSAAKKAPARTWHRFGSRRMLLVGALALLLVLAVGQQIAARHDRLSRLQSRLAAVLELRPMPIADEEPPAHVGAAPLLFDHEAALAQWPADATLHLYRGWAELRRLDYAEAIAAFQLALRFDPELIAARISLGISRLEAGDPRGRVDLDDALAQEPRTGEDHFFRGTAFFYRADFAAADVEFAHATDFGDGALAALHRALCALYQGRVDDVDKPLATFTALRPYDAWVLWIHAEVAAVRGDRTTAFAALERLRLQAPKSPGLKLRGGLLLERLGRDESAERWLRDREDRERVEAIGNGRLRYRR